MTFTKNLLIIAVICCSVYAIRAIEDEKVVPIEVTADDLLPFQEVNNGRLLGATPNPEDCLELTRKQIEGTLIVKLADFINDLLVQELIEAGELPDGKYKWGKVTGCVSSDGHGGYILKLDVTEKNICTHKCYDFKVVIHICSDYTVKLVSADTCPIDCSCFSEPILSVPSL